MLSRERLQHDIRLALERSPVVALLGPRQCGKTTAALETMRVREAVRFDLEDPVDLARLENPMLALGSERRLVVIDEIQRRPELFEILRVLVDRGEQGPRFLVLGSASPELVRGTSESLAGRVAFVDMAGFDIAEVGAESWRTLWQRGGFPRSYLAAEESSSHRWREDFVRTFLERDLPQLGISVPATTMRRFWTMLAHYHGQVLNAAELARSLSVGETTVRRYLDILSGSFVVRQLQPWHENLKKRQVKSPKVYVRDSGILHTLLSIRSPEDRESHPKLGASWEGFVIEQVLALRSEREAFFWATHGGAELDLLVFDGPRRIGFEVKYTDAPRTMRSMRVAIEDLGLDRLEIVYPGRESFALDAKIRALAIGDLVSALA
ncbi:MAG: ATP-binding protein [Myxococcota bacterium]|nr:ATP-binding protein [Myxococcota bacterium]